MGNLPATPRDLAAQAGLLPRLLLKPQDAAATLQISVRKLSDLTKRGLVPAVKIDTCVRYAMSDLAEYVRGLPRGEEVGR